MPDSKQEQIVKKIATAMAEITISNGYANDIASVQRHQASGIDLGAVPTILLKEGDNTPEQAGYTHESIRRRMEIFIVIATRQDEETDSRSGGEVLNSLAADVEKRLGLSETWDGLALWTDPPAYLEVELDATVPHLSRGLRTEIIYHHDRGNPFT